MNTDNEKKLFLAQKELEYFLIPKKKFNNEAIEIIVLIIAMVLFIGAFLIPFINTEQINYYIFAVNIAGIVKTGSMIINLLLIKKITFLNTETINTNELYLLKKKVFNAEIEFQKDVLKKITEQKNISKKRTKRI